MIIVRKSHSEYPSEGNKPKIVHSDLLIVYLDKNGNPDNAIYFDNEGQSIQYIVSFTQKNIIFNSSKGDLISDAHIRFWIRIF